ncbi:WXG100 family type VII secretion target [Saccharopolyspora shandongensis]|uniref:WXG100 family type VII secretion target n=1 Tax=Saccharopolyspora shandongensis TaxID=418495 RepID=UPI0033E92474
MTDLKMTPGTLTGHGQGCESLADKFGQLADLLHQAKVDDECFGPIGDAVGLSSKYFENLDSCKELASKAQEFLQHMKEALDETVKDYADTEQQISDMLKKAGEGLGG